MRLSDSRARQAGPYAGNSRYRHPAPRIAAPTTRHVAPWGVPLRAASRHESKDSVQSATPAAERRRAALGACVGGAYIRPSSCPAGESGSARGLTQDGALLHETPHHERNPVQGAEIAPTATRHRQYAQLAFVSFEYVAREIKVGKRWRRPGSTRQSAGSGRLATSKTAWAPQHPRHSG